MNFSGFVAWFLWRTIYLMKLPRFEKQVRVALDWTLDVIFSKDLVQFQTLRAQTISMTEDEMLEKAGIETAQPIGKRSVAGKF